MRAVVPGDNLPETSMPGDYVVFDTETTGLDPAEAELIEIGALRVRGDTVVDTFQTYIKPNGSISSFITQLTGISFDTVKDAPRVCDALPLFLDFVGDDPVVAHNAPFDLKFIRTFCQEIGQTFENKKIDTLLLARQCLTTPNHRLETIKQHFQIPLASHNALDDCRVTQYLYEYCKKQGAKMCLTQKERKRLKEIRKAEKEEQA